jgi:GTP-binding protein
MLKQWEKMPPIFITSAVKGDGKEELLNFIESTNVLF